MRNWQGVTGEIASFFPSTTLEKTGAKMSLVSAIVPVYNGENFIAATIESILAQTYCDIEIIVIDDGSTDNTPTILNQYKEQITVCRQDNSGVGAARNQGAKIAQGEFLAFIDADDLWEPDKTRIQLFEIGDAALSYTDRINFGTLGQLSAVKSDASILRDGSIFESLLREGNFITLSSVIVSKSIFDSIGGFNECLSLSGVEDWHLWLRLTKSHKVKATREPLVRYRVHAGGISKNIAAMYRAQERVLDEILTGSTKQLVNSARAYSASTSAWFAANAGDFSLARRLYLKSLKRNPSNASTWKSIVKCLVHRA